MRMDHLTMKEILEKLKLQQVRYECERYGHGHLPRSLKKIKIADKFGRDKPYGFKPYTKKEFENKVDLQVRRHAF